MLRSGDTEGPRCALRRLGGAPAPFADSKAPPHAPPPLPKVKGLYGRWGGTPPPPEGGRGATCTPRPRALPPKWKAAKSGGCATATDTHATAVPGLWTQPPPPPRGM